MYSPFFVHEYIHQGDLSYLLASPGHPARSGFKYHGAALQPGLHALERDLVRARPAGTLQLDITTIFSGSKEVRLQLSVAVQAGNVIIQTLTCSDYNNLQVLWFRKNWVLSN